jgi:hypothetical protein
MEFEGDSEAFVQEVRTGYGDYPYAQPGVNEVHVLDEHHSDIPEVLSPDHIANDEFRTGLGDTAIGGLPVDELERLLDQTNQQHISIAKKISDDDPRYTGIEP